MEDVEDKKKFVGDSDDALAFIVGLELLAKRPSNKKRRRNSNKIRSSSRMIHFSDTIYYLKRAETLYHTFSFHHYYIVINGDRTTSTIINTFSPVVSNAS